MHPQGLVKHNPHKNLKSISHKVKNTLKENKIGSSGSRPSFKPQTTRALNLNNSNQKSTLKQKEKMKISRIGILNKSNKYRGVRGAKTLLLGNPRDSIKRRSQNKTTMNYSKENHDLKALPKHFPLTNTKHRKNVTSGGSYSTIQAKSVIKRKYFGPSGNKLGISEDVGSSKSKIENSYSKQIKRIKQKSSHTFGDLSKISLILNKGKMTGGKLPSAHIKKSSVSKVSNSIKVIRKIYL